jgi:hypothetical protein
MPSKNPLSHRSRREGARASTIAAPTFTLTMSGSTLASTVGPLKIAGWISRKIDDENDPYARFHAKFWGRSMVDEAREWRDTQAPTPNSTDTTEGQDGDDNGNRSMAVGESAGEGEDEDEDEDDDDDDDDNPDCYFLDIGIDGLTSSKIWVRSEYIRLYAYLEERYSKANQRDRAPAAVVTGQPGIGESAILLSLLS